MTETDVNDALPPGFRLEEFEIIKLLGEGGFGLAYLAYDHILKQQRAIKEFLPNAVAHRSKDGTRVSARTGENRTAYQAGLRSFINEARLLASLDHPNVVRVYRCIEANNTAYLVMHYYQGETLKQRMARSGGTAPDAEWVIRLLTQLLHGLHVVHGQGVLHRDIKPSNIYLLADDRPVLIDFGAARRVVGGHTRALTGVVSAGYSPIEQYAGDSGAQEGPWTDLYALGATCYELVTGRKPWNAVMRVTSDDLKPAVELGRRHYPGVLLATIDHALKLYPKDRYQTAAEWLAVLEGKAAPPAETRSDGATIELASRKTPAQPRALSTRIPLPSARIRWITLTGLTVLLAGGTGAHFLWQRNRLPAPPPVELVTTAPPPVPATPSITLPTSPPPITAPESQPTQCPAPAESISAVVAQGRQSVKQGDYAVAILCYRLAAERGNAEAQHNLGLLYESGLGVEQNYREAAQWYRQAAEQGDADAQASLGVLHETGDGVAQNYAEAAQWYRKAADQGDASAQNNLGWLYETGHGVTRSKTEALKWYRQAAVQGDARAKDNLERLEKQ